MPNPLGTCTQLRSVRVGAAAVPCNGELAVRGDEVFCTDCGQVVPNHPYIAEQKERWAQKLATTQATPKPPPLDYPANDREAIHLLRKQLDEMKKAAAANDAFVSAHLIEQRREIDELKTEMAALWAKLGRPEEDKPAAKLRPPARK